MDQQTAVFDAAQSIVVHLWTPAGVKAILVRFPSDEEWIVWQRKRKVIVKPLGRGVSETTIIPQPGCRRPKLTPGEWPEQTP
jgi:hypothetical protein